MIEKKNVFSFNIILLKQEVTKDIKKQCQQTEMGLQKSKKGKANSKLTNLN